MKLASPRRLVKWAALVAVVGLVVLAGANVSGQLPIEGGPLGPVQSREPNAGFELVTVADGQPLYTTALVENEWPIPITILAVTVRGAVPQPAFVFVGAKHYDAADGIVLGVQHDLPLAWQSFEPIVGISVPPRGDAQHRGVAVLVRIDPVADGDNGIYDIVIDYAIGPFRFRSSAASSIGSAILICAPAGQPERFDEFCPPRG